MTDDPQATSAPAPESRPNRVDVRRGALGAVQTDDLSVSFGAIGAAQAQRASVELGAVGALAAREVSLTMSSAGLVAAQEARISQALVRSVFARDVHFARGSGAAVVFAARTDGEATVLLDWRGGLAAGTILGLVWLIVRRLR
jgi:hypothetical protein